MDFFKKLTSVRKKSKTKHLKSKHTSNATKRHFSKSLKSSSKSARSSSTDSYINNLVKSRKIGRDDKQKYKKIRKTILDSNTKLSKIIDTITHTHEVASNTFKRKKPKSSPDNLEITVTNLDNGLTEKVLLIKEQGTTKYELSHVP